MIPQPIDQVPLFLRLSEDERELLGSRLRHIEYNTNDLIFAANKPSDSMGVILQGWVRLEGQSPQGRVALANLGAGSLIGDVDLLLNRPYSTDARAASNTILLALSRQDLQDVVLQTPTIGLKFSASLGTRVAYLDEYLVTQRLGASPLLSSLSEEDLAAMASRLQFRSFARGETIFQAGDSGDALFLIEEGTARLITSSNQGQEFEEVRAGELFGQTALITAKPYAATARAVTDVSAWVLDREEYGELMREHPTVKVALSRALAETLGPEDQAQAVRQLAALPLFADVDAEALRDIASRLVLRHFPAGELIYNEGTPGDAMYFIESGEVRLVSDAATEAEYLERKIEGHSFGEMALLTGRTRAEAAKAIVDTTVWVLYKSDHDTLMVQHPTLSLALSRALSNRLGDAASEYVEHHLHQFKLLGGLSQAELKQVAEFVKPLRFRPGETICFAGQPAQYIYLIESGEVREIAGGPSGQVVVLDLIGAQQSFGEQAVVGSSTYPITVQAVGDVECWTISKPDFDRLLARYPALAASVTRCLADEVERANKRIRRLNSTPRVRPGTVPAARPAPPRPAPPRAPLGAAPAYAGSNRQPAPAGTALPASKPAQPARVPVAAPPVGVRVAPAKPWERPSTNVMRPMPAATARALAPAPAAAPRAAPVAPRPVTTTSLASFQPFASLAQLSTGTKIKLGILAFFAFWLIVIIPLALLVLLLTSNVGAASNRGTSGDLPHQIQSPGLNQFGFISNKLAIRERTATPTPLPPTAVPTSRPAAKPTRKAATTKAAVRKPEAQPTAAATPTGPVALAAAPAGPPLPPRYWDKRVGPGGLPLLTGVGVTDATVSSGQEYWRLVSMKFEDAGAESGNDHTIYISLIDENGNRVDDQGVVVSWDESGSLQIQRLGPSDEKPQGDYCSCNYNWPMYGAGYMVNVDSSLPSDKAYGMIMPEHRHVNYRLIFQRVISP